MCNEKILYSRFDHCYFIKMIGKLRFSNGMAFNNLLEKIFDDPETNDVLIDMSETEYLDSTILGLLAKIANFMIKKFDRKPTILSTSKNINFLLDSIGLSEVFIVVKTLDYTPDSLNEISDIKASELENAKTILDAHRQLMNLNEKNQEVFKDVVELLERETGKKSQ